MLFASRCIPGGARVPFFSSAHHVAKDLWEALESKFGATDAGSEMYAMEQFHDTL